MKNFLIIENKNFGLLWFGQLVSQLGDKIFSIAVMWYVLELTGSPVYVSYVMFFTMLPSILFGPFSGVLVDRLDKKKIIVLSDLIRSILMFVLCYFVFKNTVTLFHIYTIIFLTGVVTSIFNPTISASIPVIVKNDKIDNAMAWQSAIRDMSSIFGFGIGGALVGAFGVLRSFLINGLAYFLSAVFETPIKIKKNIEKTGNHFFSDLKEGFGFVIKNNTLKHMLTLFAVLNFFGPPVMIIIPVIIKETGLSGAYLGYYQMTMAIGSFLGALTVLSVTPKKNLISFLTVTLIISGVILIIMGFNQGVVLMLSMQFIMGLVLAWININLMVFFQKLTPDYIKGRFFSILETLAMFIVPFSFLLFGYMVEKYGFEFNLKLCGMAIAVSSVYFYFIPGIHSVLTGSKHEYID